MSSSVNNDKFIEDPFANADQYQKNSDRWAFIWFFSVLIIGTIAVCTFKKIDRKMYDTNAETLNYRDYKQNRKAFSKIGTERSDARAHANLSTVSEKLDGKGSQ